MIIKIGVSPELTEVQGTALHQTGLTSGTTSNLGVPNFGVPMATLTLTSWLEIEGFP